MNNVQRNLILYLGATVTTILLFFISISYSLPSPDYDTNVFNALAGFFMILLIVFVTLSGAYYWWVYRVFFIPQKQMQVKRFE